MRQLSLSILPFHYYVTLQLLSHLAESFAAEPVSVCAANRVDELNACFSPLHRTCIRAIDSVTCQQPTHI